jgi:rod shape-determining protein MreB and related proteins
MGGRSFATLRRLPAWAREDLAVDLGTANTVVYRRGQGVVLFEPSVVAIDERTGAVHAVGAEAKRMIGRTPATIRATRPLRDGVIADFDVTEAMLRYFLAKAGTSRFSSPRIVLCVPTGITDVERRAVVEATIAAGARQAYLIEEPMAGAIGAGLPVAEPRGTLIVDIGGGTSEVAVIALGASVVSQSLRIGGYELDEAIVRHTKQEHGLLIGQERAEEVKIEIGSAVPLSLAEDTADVAGRDLLTGLLKRITLTADEVRAALAHPLAQIVETVTATLEQTPPELAADLSEQGLVLVGGGALLRGIDERLRAETQLPVFVADSPLTCVAVGAGQSLEELRVLEQLRTSRDGEHRRRRGTIVDRFRPGYRNSRLR